MLTDKISSSSSCHDVGTLSLLLAFCENKTRSYNDSPLWAAVGLPSQWTSNVVMITISNNSENYNDDDNDNDDNDDVDEDNYNQYYYHSYHHRYHRYYNCYYYLIIICYRILIVKSHSLLKWYPRLVYSLHYLVYNCLSSFFGYFKSPFVSNDPGRQNHRKLASLKEGSSPQRHLLLSSSGKHYLIKTPLSFTNREW